MKESHKRLILTIPSRLAPKKSTDLLELTTKTPCWVPRYLAEEDPTFLQVIPYVVFQNEKGEYLSFTRNGTEERLRNQRSIGFGGHIEISDLIETTIPAAVFHAMHRELKEELGVTPLNYKLMDAVIYTNDNPVSSVHIGLPILCTDWSNSEGNHEFTQDDEVRSLEWSSLENLKSSKLETWSNIALDIIESHHFSKTSIKSASFSMEELPPSLNAMYRVSKFGKTYLTKEGKDFKIRVEKHALGLHVSPLVGPIELFGTFVLPDHRRRDLDNLMKITLDSLQGILFEDDSQIEKIYITKKVEKGVSKFRITVLKLS